jgi:hypothetical protein
VLERARKSVGLLGVVFKLCISMNKSTGITEAMEVWWGLVAGLSGCS